jgi:hypothetical protein
MMILVAGPYRSSTGDDPLKIAANVRAMMDVALELFVPATCRCWANGSPCR